jgi:cation diffusion facilitator CzcD-associated flavoprotein CzcO
MVHLLIKVSYWEWPKIDGLKDYKGVLVHSAAYPEGLDLANKRVAVVGIGSSGVQIIAKIQSQVEKLYTWISTPTWMTPGFAPKYSGPGGRNFRCKFRYHSAGSTNTDH